MAQPSRLGELTEQRRKFLRERGPRTTARRIDDPADVLVRLVKEAKNIRARKRDGIANGGGQYLDLIESAVCEIVTLRKARKHPALLKTLSDKQDRINELDKALKYMVDHTENLAAKVYCIAGTGRAVIHPKGGGKNA